MIHLFMRAALWVFRKILWGLVVTSVTAVLVVLGARVVIPAYIETSYRRHALFIDLLLWVTSVCMLLSFSFPSTESGLNGVADKGYVYIYSPTLTPVQETWFGDWYQHLAPSWYLYYHPGGITWLP